MVLRLALFAEAIKGKLHQPQSVSSLPELLDITGLPKEEKAGLTLAIQALLYKTEVLLFRVEEEGFSLNDYFQGLKYLENMKPKKKIAFQALGIPGIGSLEIIEEAKKVCQKHKSILIINEKDLYDCLTAYSSKAK